MTGILRHPARWADWQEGGRLFNAGKWWEAHEAWEGPWQEAAGDDRRCLQALILLAAALHKRWHHGSLTHRNFEKAGRYLAQLPPSYAALDLLRLRGDVWEALNAPARTEALPQLWTPGGRAWVESGGPESSTDC